MLHIRRIDPSALLTGKGCFAFVGGGGKTTLSEYLAERSVEDGYPSAVTTTTKIYAVEPYALFRELPGEPSKEVRWLRIGADVRDGKLTALSLDAIRDLGRLYDRLFIEADGAKGLPLKIPSDHEPVIPPWCDLTFVVAGLDALGRKAGEVVFRRELLGPVMGIDDESVITPALFERFFCDTVLLKDVDRGKSIIVLNKYDLPIDRQDVRSLAERIVTITGGVPVLVAAVHRRIFSLFREG